MAQNDHNTIKMNTVNHCMIEFYHEENEALHNALAKADQLNRGLRTQRDYNARLAQQANIRADTLEVAYDRAERYALYQEFVLQDMLQRLSNYTRNQPIERGMLQWHIHRIYAGFYPNGEAPEINLPEPEPMEIEDDEETESETEDEGLADDEMDTEL